MRKWAFGSIFIDEVDALARKLVEQHVAERAALLEPMVAPSDSAQVTRVE